MSLTDDQVLRWFGPPVAAFKRAGIPADIPKVLHADWRLLRSHGYSNREARIAIMPSIRKLLKVQSTS